MLPERMDLDTAYQRYRDGKGIGRSDLFRLIIDELKELNARIGSVDEKAVSGLGHRLTSLETTIGNALRLSAAPTAIMPAGTIPDMSAYTGEFEPIPDDHADSPVRRGGWPKGRSRKPDDTQPVAEGATNG